MPGSAVKKKDIRREITMTDVIIIGSGPAGLTAAIYARRAGFSVLVIEKAPMSGGQIVNTGEVDNYPGLQGINGFEMGMKFREHAEYAGAVFAEGMVQEIRSGDDGKEVVTERETYQTRAVIIAAGAAYAGLGVPGEEALKGHGVSYCATCDGAFFRGRGGRRRCGGGRCHRPVQILHQSVCHSQKGQSAGSEGTAAETVFSAGGGNGLGQCGGAH